MYIHIYSEQRQVLQIQGLNIALLLHILGFFYSLPELRVTELPSSHPREMLHSDQYAEYILKSLNTIYNEDRSVEV